MVSQIISVNGITPITSAPPADVAPTIEGYGMTIGVTELTESGQPIPAVLLEAGLIEYPVTYEFEEYALVLQAEEVTKLPLSGMTIDWSASELSESGSLNAQFGVTTHYDLAGKEFSTFQFTYLQFACVLVENGHEKSASWTVRMKHF
ncbi:MAG: hypothetical protein WD716_13430 [Fimbriimonadaceae bacterium]